MGEGGGGGGEGNKMGQQKNELRPYLVYSFCLKCASFNICKAKNVPLLVENEGVSEIHSFHWGPLPPLLT